LEWRVLLSRRPPLSSRPSLPLPRSLPFPRSPPRVRPPSGLDPVPDPVPKRWPRDRWPPPVAGFVRPVAATPLFAPFGSGIAVEVDRRVEVRPVDGWSPRPAPAPPGRWTDPCLRVPVPTPAADWTAE